MYTETQENAYNWLEKVQAELTEFELLFTKSLRNRGIELKNSIESWYLLREQPNLIVRLLSFFPLPAESFIARSNSFATPHSRSNIIPIYLTRVNDAIEVGWRRKQQVRAWRSNKCRSVVLQLEIGINLFFLPQRFSILDRETMRSSASF